MQVTGPLHDGEPSPQEGVSFRGDGDLAVGLAPSCSTTPAMHLCLSAVANGVLKHL